MWGDAVNTASRMESHGVGGCIQIAVATYELIKNDFICEPRGAVNVKGKGDMNVWCVLGKALKKLKEYARSINADAIVGFRVEMVNYSNNYVGKIMAYGTAVKFKAKTETDPKVLVKPPAPK